MDFLCCAYTAVERMVYKPFLTLSDTNSHYSEPSACLEAWKPLCSWSHSCDTAQAFGIRSVERELRSGAEGPHKHPSTVNIHLPAPHDLICCVNPAGGSPRPLPCCSSEGLGTWCRAQPALLKKKVGLKLAARQKHPLLFPEHFTKAGRFTPSSIFTTIAETTKNI